MRRYLLDSGVLAAFFQGRNEAVRLIDPWLDRGEVATSILVYGEVTVYLRGKSNFELRQLHLRGLLREIRPVFLTYPILERYADIRRSFRPPHGPGLIGDIDTLIAATALEHRLTVVTTDRDFNRVTGLEVMVLDRYRFTPID